MSSPFLRLCAAVLLGCGVAHAAKPVLRICADPDNPPYSLRDGSGFDNRIAKMLAQQIGREPVFVWTRARRGFMREQFNKDACDMLQGVPAEMRSLLATTPYYRSTYVFVARAREGLHLASFSDPKLERRRIGLQIMEEDLSPPSLPLIRYGYAAQLVGFDSFGSRASDIVRAVADRRIDVAVVWGPLAGFYAARLPGLELSAVSPQVDAGIPFTFSIAMGVHKKDLALRDQLDAAIRARQREIDRILASSHVPVLPLEGGTR